MAQLGARLNGIEKVVGSNPTGSTQSELGVVIGEQEISFQPDPQSLFPITPKARTGVVGHLPASRGHRLKAPAKASAERQKAELACRAKAGCTGEDE